MSAQAGQDVEVHRWARVLRRHLALFTGIVVVVLGLALAAALLPQPRYHAVATVVIDPTVGSPLQTNSNDTPVLSPAEMTLATSALVRRTAEKTLGYPAAISVQADQQGLTLTFESSEADAARATTVANTYATVYTGERNNRASASYRLAVTALQQAVARLSSASSLSPDGSNDARLAQQRDAYNKALSDLQVRGVLAGVSVARLAVPADVPDHATRPPLGSYLLIGLFAAFALAVAAVGIAEATDSSVRGGDVLRDVTNGLPVLALVPRRPLSRRMLERLRARAPEDAAAPAPPVPAHELQTYRTLRMTVLHSSVPPPRFVNVTSARKDDAASTVALQLAATFALSGDATVLAGLDQNAAARLTAIMRDAQTVSEAVPRADVAPIVTIRRLPGVKELTAVVLEQPTADGTLGGAGVESLLDEFDSLDQVVIGLSGPVLSDGDALTVAARVDATLLVVRAGRTAESDLSRSVELLSMVGASVVGVVVVDSDAAFSATTSAQAATPPAAAQLKSAESERRARTPGRPEGIRSRYAR